MSPLKAVAIYVASALIIAGGFGLHATVLQDAPQNAFLVSLLAGVIVTAVLTMLGRDDQVAGKAVRRLHDDRPTHWQQCAPSWL